MNIASIDIGTNTILLLIAKVTDSKIIPLHNEYRIPRIGKGIKANHPITQEKIDLFIKILIEYKKIIDSYNCELVIANATNAMRLASNSKEIIEMVFNETGFLINIISGEEEAKLSFLGAASINDSNDIFLVIDIGGGSTEIIYGQNKKIIFSKSFQIGAVSLTEKYFKHNPPFKEEILNALNEIKQVFEELNNS
jgi:exopolyphosphatase / guanosine-5'-triphosphate,3'-diphosphate pyrophosphatase